MAASRESPDEDMSASGYEESDNIIRPKFDSEAPPPPPPEFGTVLPAPPASSAEMPALPATGEQATAGRNNARIVVIAASVAVVLGIAGFAAGRLGSDGDEGEAPPASEEVSAAPAQPPKPEPVKPQPAPVNAAAAVEPPCPAGMVHLESGKFFMGTASNSPLMVHSQPSHQVSVGAFCIDETEVTLRAYRECSSVGECKRAFRDAWWPQGGTETAAWDYSREQHSKLCNENYDSRDEHPINCVTWSQANDYCRWRGAKLPTEVQWEYAARGSEGRRHPWGDAAPSSEHLNACGDECVKWQASVDIRQTGTLYEQDDGFPGTAPVGSFPAGKTEAGLVDMAGNVFEWTADLYEPYPGNERQGADELSKKRVLRGGAFSSFRAEFADPALRYPQSPNAHTDAIGFRCVTDPRR